MTGRDGGRRGNGRGSKVGRREVEDKEQDRERKEGQRQREGEGERWGVRGRHAHICAPPCASKHTREHTHTHMHTNAGMHMHAHNPGPPTHTVYRNTSRSQTRGKKKQGSTAGPRTNNHLLCLRTDAHVVDIMPDPGHRAGGLVPQELGPILLIYPVTVDGGAPSFAIAGSQQDGVVEQLELHHVTRAGKQPEQAQTVAS